MRGQVNRGSGSDERASPDTGRNNSQASRGDRHSSGLLAAVLLTALAARAYVIGTQLYAIHSDETFQYLEQGYRLATGSGVVPWEYIDGVRSWLVPGIAGGLIRMCLWFSGEPSVYLTVIRLCAAGLSLTPVYIGFWAGHRIAGVPGALLTGTICAIWFEAIYFAPVVMTEMFSAHTALWALFLNATVARETSEPAHGRRLAGAGACYALAACLRPHYSPALLVAAMCLNRLDTRRWRPLLTSAVPVGLAAGGVLDMATWGTPFQSIWLYVTRNTVEGVSAANGVRPWFWYVREIWWIWQAAAPLAVFAVIGACRLPALGLTALVVLVSHSALAHKEYRFIYLALIAAPILIGVGLSVSASWLVRWMAVWKSSAPAVRRAGAALTVPWFFIPGILVPIAILSLYEGTHGVMARRWMDHRILIRAYLDAHARPDLRGLGVVGFAIFNGGGYVYLNRDVPVFFSDYQPEVFLHGSAVPFRTRIMFRGQPLAQYTEQEMVAFRHRYNYLIAPEGTRWPGFEQVSCVPDPRPVPEPSPCLFRRPGTTE